MEKVAKSLYLNAVKEGFTPKYEVRKTSHGRYYYLVDSDFRNLIRLTEKLEGTK